MRATSKVLLASALLCAFLLSAGTLWAAPKISAATADPASVAPGGTTKLVCRLDDPEGLVQKVVGIVREAPDYVLAFTKGDDGTWVSTVPIPRGAAPGTYHVDVELADAGGKPIAPESGSSTAIAITVAGSEVVLPPAPRAADPAPELVTTEATTQSGARIVLRSPYRSYPNWYKGQMHCHTTNSDGQCTPAQLEAKYRQAGNDFLIITDHEQVTSDPAAESGSDVPVVVPGEERGTEEGHMIVVGLAGHLPSRPGQELIDQAVSRQGLVMVNHPEWRGGIYDIRELDRLVGYQFMEMCNGGESHERPWDYVLSKGHKYVWGVASDDFHGGPGDEVARCFIVVNAPELTAQAILGNLKAGNFYSSEGPKLDMSLTGDSLVVKSDQESTVTFRGRYGIPYLKSVITPGQMDWASYRFQGDEGYVRVEVERHSDRKHAWSQPVFVEMK